MGLPFGYDTELSEASAGLSGGERQRLSIARAFFKDAPISSELYRRLLGEFT